MFLIKYGSYNKFLIEDFFVKLSSQVSGLRYCVPIQILPFSHTDLGVPVVPSEGALAYSKRKTGYHRGTQCIVFSTLPSSML